MITKKSLKKELEAHKEAISIYEKTNITLVAKLDESVESNKALREGLKEVLKPSNEMNILFSAIDKYNETLDRLGFADPVIVGSNLREVYKKFGVNIPKRTVPPVELYTNKKRIPPVSQTANPRFGDE